MRIAIENPTFLLTDQSRNFNGYNYIFFKKYVDTVYIMDPRKISAYRKVFSSMGKETIRIVYSGRVLNSRTDVLVCFNGQPNRLLHKPPALFKGIKIFHIMDFVFYTKDANTALEKASVDYLMGYCNHGKHNEFFRKMYPSYIDKILPVPFGYGERFKYLKPFEERINKAIAVGSVNPVNDPLCPKGMLDDYIAFYPNVQFSHILRREIVLNREIWADAIDNLLPIFPETKNPHYDPVKILNDYTMFINDEGLMNFPPARTYEGIACGCVMVAANTNVFTELGFEDGVNAILFQPGNYDDMMLKIRYYMMHPLELKFIQNKSLQLAKSFSHESIADKLYNDIRRIYDRKY